MTCQINAFQTNDNATSKVLETILEQRCAGSGLTC